MILLKHFIVLFASVFYGISLSYISNMSEKRLIKRIVDLVLAVACLTSIDFMSTVFEICSWVKYLCFILMAFSVIVLPLLLKNKFSD